MKEFTLGSYIRSLRLQHQMTQAQLAEKLNITDKAVSKWERNLSCPDIALFPRLAELLGVGVDDLLKECVDGGQPSRLVQVFDMSHDIRTPLHIILGCADLAEHHYDDKTQVLRYLQSIRISGEYLLKTIDAISQLLRRMQGEADSSYFEHLGKLESRLRDVSTSHTERLDSYDFTGARILVAEDMEINREIAGEMLKPTGAETDFAVDGQDCLDKVAAHPEDYYDLILMDIMMPGMDGIEAARRIRSMADGRASIPIIAVSANTQGKEKRAAREAGMNGFCEKPVSVEKLLSTVREQLRAEI